MLTFPTFKESWGMWKDAISPHLSNIRGAPEWGAKKVWNTVIKPEHIGKSGTELVGEYGEYLRGGITKPAVAFGKGFLGEGGYDYATGKQGFYPDWFPQGGKGQWFGEKDPDKPNIIDKIGDAADAAKGAGEAVTGRIEDPFGGFDLQAWLSGLTGDGGLVNIPPLDLTPVKEGMSDFALALAMGLGSLGQGIGGGIPEMPSMQLMSEEGEPNILLLGGLAAVAYVVLKGKK